MAEDAIEHPDQDEALAIAVHELNNELSVLATWAGLLLRADVGADRRRQAAEAIHRGTEIARRVCEDIVAISGNREPAFVPTRVDLTAIATAGVHAVSADARRKGVRVVCRGSRAPVWVMGDGVRLGEVVTNLLRNALTVTGPTDAITVDVSNIDGRARLVVADTGDGISAALLPHIFDKFPRGNGPDGRERGLGLFVVRRLVELHQGSVKVESDGRGLGARVIVTLRSAAADAA